MREFQESWEAHGFTAQSKFLLSRMRGEVMSNGRRLICVEKRNCTLVIERKKRSTVRASRDLSGQGKKVGKVVGSGEGW